VQLVANDRREADRAPDFRIMVGTAEIGAAWRRPRRSSDEMLDQTALKIPLQHFWPERQKVEAVGGLENLLSESGLSGGQCPGEIR
jgi:Protein of unknown function (DUF736)